MAAGKLPPMRRVFLVLDPEEAPKSRFENFTFGAWPSLIKNCHKWQFEWADPRRRRAGSMLSKDKRFAMALRVKAECCNQVKYPEIKDHC